MKRNRLFTAALALSVLLIPAAFSQEKVDVGMVNRI
jgi:hypothetical protein